MAETAGERTFNASMDEFEAMQDYVTVAAAAAGFDRSLVGKIQLASEEALVNVINYAYDGGPGTVTIAWALLPEGGLRLQLSDSGRAFDPLARPDPDITVPLESVVTLLTSDPFASYS